MSDIRKKEEKISTHVFRSLLIPPKFKSVSYCIQLVIVL